MITENPNSENEELKPTNDELQTAPEHQGNADTQKSLKIPEEKILSEIDSAKEEMLTEKKAPETPEISQTETMAQTPEHQENIHVQKPFEIPEEKVLSEIDPEAAQEEEHDHTEAEAIAGMSLVQILNEMEKLVNRDDAGAQFKKFNQYRDQANHLIHDETEDKKHEFEASASEENFTWEHPQQSRLSGLNSIFREKNNDYHKKQEEEHAQNLENRQNIIEKLKHLYTNTEPGTNLFKAIREIKQEWQNAGQVAKAEFKLLNNNYFHHLNQFYAMLDMNKEYMEQEYAHNLEKRQHIIERAKELENETAVQKALNELQYLHKLWKEEAEPVAEEFREKTWEEFREISNRIHDRKTELSAQIEEEQNANLEKKNRIIEEIKKITTPENAPNHSYWQNSIRKVEDLRTEFLKLGSVPRKISNQNWNDFKTNLRAFNNAKNEFYKGLKNSQQKNLEDKMKLIQTAQDNMNTEDWEMAVPLFKKLQEEWKNIGHVPRSMTNKVWEDFREACNTFFNNYRSKNAAAGDNWKENYKLKKELLEELKVVGDEEGSVEKIEHIKNSWNAIGKVPRDKMTINSEFNKTLREKLKANKMNEYELKEEGLSENQLTDKARKIKNQIADLEAEIAKLENNLGFFSNTSRENPLLKDTYANIDEKKMHLENMKQNLHSIISGE